MSPKSLFDITVRLLGLFFLVSAFIDVPVLLITVENIASYSEKPVATRAMWILASAGISFIAGILLLIYGGRIVKLSESSGEDNQTSDIPLMAVQVMGIYFGVGSIESLLYQLTRWPWMPGTLGVGFAQVVAPAIMMVFSGFLITRAAVVVVWLRRLRELGT